MDRRRRLTGSIEFQRVRSAGKAYAHPLVVLVARRNDLGSTRCGVSAGRRCGGAVERNRAKRRLRAIWSRLAPSIAPGWDVVLEARRGSVTAEAGELLQSVIDLTRRAGLRTDTE